MRETVIPEKIFVEEIISDHHRIGDSVEFHVAKGFVNDKGVFEPHPNQNYEIFRVSNSLGYADYDLLMSANPDFAPKKPANLYRIEDLWHFVDLIRERITVKETGGMRQQMNISIDKSVILADGEDKVTLLNVPLGAKISLTNNSDVTSGIADSSIIEFTAHLPATYKITIEFYPFLTWFGEFIAK